jgi:porin
MPGWTLQPNVQYVFHPGGRIADPADPTGRTPIRNALVVGLRSGWRC